MLQLLRRVNERIFPAHLFFGPTHAVIGVNNSCNLRIMGDMGTGIEPLTWPSLGEALGYARAGGLYADAA
jgi:hypothetical protein